jgi:PqqD family protein of HPr-rel-A system
MVTAPLYRSDFRHHCRTHAIDGMTLVFHRPSGITHFLDSPASEILAILAEGPTDAASLTRRLCEQLDSPDDDEARIVVEARLAELIASGLAQVA